MTLRHSVKYAQCLKITKKVSFHYIASNVMKVYFEFSRKNILNIGHFWDFQIFCDAYKSLKNGMQTSCCIPSTSCSMHTNLMHKIPFGLQLGEDLLDPSGFTSLLGGTTYLLAGFSTILALWKTAKIT